MDFILVHSQNKQTRETKATNRTIEDAIINILSSTYRAWTFEPFTVPVFLFIRELCWATKESIILFIFVIMMNSKLGGVKSY